VALDQLARWSPLTGVAFVVVAVAAGVMFMDAPPPGASDDEILRYYADSGNQNKLAIAFVLTTIAAPLLLWFVGTLAACIRNVEVASGWLSRIALVSGGAFVAVAFVGTALGQFVPDAVNNDPDAFTLDPDTARLLTNASYTLMPELAVPLSAPLVLATSLAALAHSLLPRWLGWAGCAVALVSFVGFIVGPTFLYLWVLFVSVFLFRSRSPGRPSRSQE
jgi:hypothetical protein